MICGQMMSAVGGGGAYPRGGLSIICSSRMGAYPVGGGQLRKVVRKIKRKMRKDLYDKKTK